MKTNNENNSLERLKFSSSQSLYVSDMEGIGQVNREMRWLHNRTMHQYGIGSGFAVSGEIGDREVRVEPGCAIDSKGREIVLVRTKILPVPPVVGSKNNKPAFYDLMVSYPEEQDLEEVETRQGVCLDRGTVRLREEPNFCWVELDPDKMQPKNDHLGLKEDIQTGLMIRIIRAEIQDCKLSKKISIAQRQNARPAQGPNIVADIYRPDPSRIEWKVWELGERKVGLKIFVDTSCAQFTISPDYKAEIVGERFVDETIDPNLQSITPNMFSSELSGVDTNAIGRGTFWLSGEGLWFDMIFENIEATELRFYSEPPGQPEAVVYFLSIENNSIREIWRTDDPNWPLLEVYIRQLQAGDIYVRVNDTDEHTIIRGRLNPVLPYILEGFTSVLIPEKNNKPITTGFELYITMHEMFSLLLQVNPSEFLYTYTNEQRQQILYRLGWAVKWMGIE